MQDCVVAERTTAVTTSIVTGCLQVGSPHPCFLGNIKCSGYTRLCGHDVETVGAREDLYEEKGETAGI